jgi:shikimate dehydrogenase
MKLFSIFGNPVSHSISPKMHNSAIKDFNLDACYIRTCINEPQKLMQTFHALALSGANVTVPHKEVALQQCDSVDDFAKLIGAVNTLVKTGEKVKGYNTDAPGFYKAIESFGQINNALILGAGGTAKAIATILRDKKIKPTIVNRSSSRLDFFIQNDFQAFCWDTFDVDSFDLIINTTSAGLSDEQLPLDKKLLESLMQKSKYAFDVIYNKKTPFLQLAHENSLTCKDGADMLLYQGVLAFNLFFENKLNLQQIEISMRRAFTL